MPYKDPEVQRAAQQEWYKRNKKQRLAKSYAQRARNRAWLREQKAKPCMDCGLEWPYYVMEYHHRDGATKLGSVSNLLITAGRARIEAEIAKCDLICSNCHRIRTHQTELTELDEVQDLVV